MGEVTFNIRNFGVAKIRLDSTEPRGGNLAGQPVLYLPFKLQLRPAGPQQQPLHYVLLRLAGSISSQHLPGGEFATFEARPLAELSNPSGYDRQLDILVHLDRTRVTQFEDARAGGDANLSFSFWALIWLSTAFAPGQSPFEVIFASSLQILVPKSHWVEKVVQLWDLDSTKLIEIRFPKSQVGENFRVSYTRVEEAERLFLNGDYKQVLTTLRLSFEALAKSLGAERAGREFFESLFTSCHPDKREKARDALTAIYRFLHLGPHEQSVDQNTTAVPVVTRQDARFALTLAHAIFEYIAPAV